MDSKPKPSAEDTVNLVVRKLRIVKPPYCLSMQAVRCIYSSDLGSIRESSNIAAHNVDRAAITRVNGSLAVCSSRALVPNKYPLRR